MVHRISRAELHQLVWSIPVKQLAPRFGVSDVAVKKACEKASIPTPDRGYWAKVDAGQRLPTKPLPPRPPGMNDDIEFGATHSYWGGSPLSNDEVLGPVPPPPTFSEPLEEVRQRIAKSMGDVVVRRDTGNWHPSIATYLRKDDQKREKQRQSKYFSSWDAPVFEGPFEKRRLRILNALFHGLMKLGGRPSLRGFAAREVVITFHYQHVWISLEGKNAKPPQQYVPRSKEPDDHTLVLSILAGYEAKEVLGSWSDNQHQNLETQLAQAAIGIALQAEESYRAQLIRSHEWRIERKAQLEKEERERQAAQVKAEAERKARLEQKRIDNLLTDARALETADTIRRYVAQLEERVGVNAETSFQQWRQWALSQADRMDPSLDAKFLRSFDD